MRNKRLHDVTQPFCFWEGVDEVDVAKESIRDDDDADAEAATTAGRLVPFSSVGFSSTSSARKNIESSTLFRTANRLPNVTKAQANV